jgi:hypothetical protein
MISSTVVDLPKHREEVRAACEEQGVFPLMMEHQPASYENPTEFSMRLVDEADAYIGVYAYRYGYVPPGGDSSLTEMEYDRAAERSIPLLIFIMHKDHPIRADDKEEGEGARKLESFKQRVETKNVVRFFTSPEDLRAHVVSALSHLPQPEAGSFQSALTEIRRALLQASSLQELSDCLYRVRSLIERFPNDPCVPDARLVKNQIEEAVEKEASLLERLYRRMKRVGAHPAFYVVMSVVAIVITMATFTDSVQKLVNLFRKAPAPVLTPGTAVRICKATGNPSTFSVEGHFWATGKTGDIGDVEIAPLADLERFTYPTNGRGPHEWEWKYVSGQLSPEIAQFGGVMYLNPPNNFGKEATGGFDLRGYHLIKWQARSLAGRVNVDFSMGGVTWVWDDKARVKVTPPFPESLSVKRLGVKTLDSNWQEFEAPFAPEDDLRCVINGFAWTISWGSNGVSLNDTRTGPMSARTFQFGVRNIRYER